VGVPVDEGVGAAETDAGGVQGPVSKALGVEAGDGVGAEDGVEEGVGGPVGAGVGGPEGPGVCELVGDTVDAAEFVAGAVASEVGVGPIDSDEVGEAVGVPIQVDSGVCDGV